MYAWVKSRKAPLRLDFQLHVHHIFWRNFLYFSNISRRWILRSETWCFQSRDSDLILFSSWIVWRNRESLSFKVGLSVKKRGSYPGEQFLSSFKAKISTWSQHSSLNFVRFNEAHRPELICCSSLKITAHRMLLACMIKRCIFTVILSNADDLDVSLTFSHDMISAYQMIENYRTISSLWSRLANNLVQ